MREKRRLAELCETTPDYAEAKEPWFDRALPRAQDWAQRSGWVPGKAREASDA